MWASASTHKGKAWCSSPGQSSSDFLIDGVLIQSVAFRAGAFTNELFLGDATGGPNAQGDVTQFRFVQTPTTA